MNSEDGITWGNQTSDGIGLIGVAYGSGRFVAITSTERIAFSSDGGNSWQEGGIPGANEVRGILFDGVRFIVTTSGATFTSSSGSSWESHDTNGGPGRFDASWDRQHYAGAQGGSLYHSLDGVAFTRVKQAGQGIERVKFGYGKPSTVCPL